MAIVCIKIGENESFTYSRFNLLTKHGDIIDILPRKVRSNQTRLSDDRSPGQEAEKSFFCLNVNLSQFSDTEFQQIRHGLTQPFLEDTGELEPDNVPIYNQISKRLYYVDFALAPFLSAGTIVSLNSEATKRRAKQSIDMRPINRMDQVITWPIFQQIVMNKATDKSLIDTPII